MKAPAHPQKYRIIWVIYFKTFVYCLHIIFTLVFRATQVRIIYLGPHKGNALGLCNIRCDFALQSQSVQSTAAISDMAKNTNRRRVRRGRH